MSMAVKLGRDTPGAGNVGCVIVRDGIVLASGFNEAEMRCDPAARLNLLLPAFSFLDAKLSAMGTANDCRQVPGSSHGIGAGYSAHFQLQVLRH